MLRCQVGDEAAFFELYNLFSERTLRYLQGLLDYQSAEDVHQEVWLSVYQKVSALVNPKGFRTWLYQITRNRAIDYLRRSKRHPELLDSVKEVVEEYTNEAAGEDLTDAEVKSLEKAMEQLNTKHRDVLILKYWEEMSYEEISLILGCSIGTVRSRIYNAKENLKKILSTDSRVPGNNKE